MIDVNTHEFRVDRIDNGDGTHTIMVDHVQVGPPIPWSDTLTEHMVRQTCLRIQREIRPVETAPLAPPARVDPFQVGPQPPESFRIYYGDPFYPFAPPSFGFTVTS